MELYINQGTAGIYAVFLHILSCLVLLDTIYSKSIAVWLYN